MPLEISNDKFPVLHVRTANCDPLNALEAVILQHVPKIEAWFRKRWHETPAPITSSVDLRNGGFKLAPVDTNLFPAGFNNLNPEFLPLCIQAVQSTLYEMMPTCTHILLVPESHTRNPYYLQSLNVLRGILMKAGFVVRVGSLDPELTVATVVLSQDGDSLTLEPLRRENNSIGLDDFKPCLVILNNDLSAGIPDILKDIVEPIVPALGLGWSSRLKSQHFKHYDTVASEFAALLDIDPWLINPMFTALSGLDFMAQEGIDALALLVEQQLSHIKEQYLRYDIKDKPFVVVKSDNGTYGMSVMMVHDAQQIRDINRKQRTKMSASKGSRKVERVIIQEGVYTFETMEDGAVAEPVVYMIGSYVVGGFYRVHQERGVDENLNAPGMHFVPLAFAKPCNMPQVQGNLADCPNRFYVYGVIARLAALAAAREAKALGV